MSETNREPTPELSSQFLGQAEALAELLGPHITNATLIAWSRMFIPVGMIAPEQITPSEIQQKAKSIVAFIEKILGNDQPGELGIYEYIIIIAGILEGSNQVGKDTVAEEERRKKGKKGKPLPFQKPDKELKEPPPILIAEILGRLQLGECPEYLRELCEQVTIRQLLKGQKLLPNTQSEVPGQGNILSDPALQLFNFILGRIAFTQKLRDVSTPSENSSKEVIETVVVRNFMSSMVYQAFSLAYMAWLQHTVKEETPNINTLTPEQIQTFEDYLIYYQELIAHIHILLMLKGLVYTPQQITVFYAVDHLPEDIMPKQPAENTSSRPIYMRINNLFETYRGKIDHNRKIFWLLGLIHKARSLVATDNQQNTTIPGSSHPNQNNPDQDSVDIIEAAMQTQINGEKTLWPENMLYLYAVRALKRALEHYPDISIDLREVLARRLSDEEISELTGGDGSKLSEILGQAFTECCDE